MNGAATGTVTFDGRLTVSAGTFTGAAGDITLTGGMTVSGGVVTLAGGSTTVTGTMVVSGGSFTGGAGNIDLNNTFTLSSPGSFTAPSGTFFAAGAWTHTDASVFTHNSGTVTFDGGAAGIDVNVTETFFNVTFNTTSNKTVSTGDTLIVMGTLTLTNGGFLTGTVEARGNVIHGAGFDGGLGTLSITGTDVRTINLTADGYLPVVNLNAANVTIYGPDSGTAYINKFFLTDGSFVGGAGNLNIYSSNTTSVFSITLPASFTAPSGILTVAGGFSHADASVFNHNSGMVMFSGGSATIDVDDTETFNNVTFNATTAITKTITSGDTLIAEGTLTLTDGGVDTGTLEARGGV